MGHEIVECPLADWMFLEPKLVTVSDGSVPQMDPVTEMGDRVA